MIPLASCITDAAGCTQDAKYAASGFTPGGAILLLIIILGIIAFLKKKK